jgi:hypothetical protein
LAGKASERPRGPFCARASIRRSRVDFLLTGSRAATVTAGRLGIRSFVIVDDEFVAPLVSGLAGTNILYPNLIPAYAFRRRGVRRERLLPFPGLRQDISFATSTAMR